MVQTNNSFSCWRMGFVRPQNTHVFFCVLHQQSSVTSIWEVYRQKPRSPPSYFKLNGMGNPIPANSPVRHIEEEEFEGYRGFQLILGPLDSPRSQTRLSGGLWAHERKKTRRMRKSETKRVRPWCLARPRNVADAQKAATAQTAQARPFLSTSTMLGIQTSTCEELVYTIKVYICLQKCI